MDLLTTLEAGIKMLILFGGLMGGAAYLVLVERWMAAWIQDRIGPNRAGIPLTRIRLFGLGQPIADGGKFIFKEEFTPSHVEKLLYFLAPVVSLTAAVGVFAVVPFGEVEILGYRLQLVVAPGVDVGLLYIVAVSGLGVLGVLLGGWASNNKYSLFGGIRAAAQLLSYEIPLGLALLGIVLATGSLRLEEIVLWQAQSGLWHVFWQPLGFTVFFLAAFAEAGRLPFDMAEAEQELVGGYHTEYSGMKLMMYMVAEYLHMILASFLLVLVFFGGWHFWGLTGEQPSAAWPTALLRVLILLGKVLVVIWFFMVARWSWPRFRFDQIMHLAWYVLIPVGILYVVSAAILAEYGAAWAALIGMHPSFFLGTANWVIFFAVCGFLAWVVPANYDNRPLPSPIRPQAPTPHSIP
ncbi:MAG: NADH-quinone oxidoreductase subunit H [Thermoguttaceae bacterium]|nr:NADH-quinone oxidoreductase subunit H [Thermoguttaceae bacterium]MDW8039751.1 complex I subunit 1 family protein [Thermoguttaceae bacterium]